MTRRDALQCIHEPFGDAFYYGPERLSSRYEDDDKARLESGFAPSTFRTVLDKIEKEGAEVRITPSSVASSPAAILEVFGNPPSILDIYASAPVLAAALS